MRKKYFIEDYLGKKINHLSVIEDLGIKNGRHKILVQCDCEKKTIKEIRFEGLYSGDTTSCGCHAIKVCSTNNLSHGGYKTREFRCWTNMRQRCNNPNKPIYKYYGGRGISVCPEWEDFAVFLRDMGYAPSPEHTIERVDNDKGYFPENCRWATRKEQSNNLSTNNLVEFNGETKTLAQWSDSLNLPRNMLRNRIFVLGWSIEKALTTRPSPTHPRRRPSRQHTSNEVSPDSKSTPCTCQDGTV